jgi:ribonucleoside-diphosphate reductase alpha chain
MKVRNVSVTSIAPTGSIALIAGVNSSIEPFFALAYKRHITQGVGNIATDTIIEINPILFRKLKKYGLDDKQIEEIKKKVVKTGSIQGIDEIPEKLRAVFKTSQEIKWEDHVTAQASWQAYVTNAVSKTINMPETATVEDVENAYTMMWDKNLKGGTIYRNNSKSFQILNAGK